MAATNSNMIPLKRSPSSTLASSSMASSRPPALEDGDQQQDQWYSRIEERGKQLKALASGDAFVAQQAKIEGLMNSANLVRNVPSLGVLGKTKAGKSTLLNAIFKPCLPTSTDFACTSVKVTLEVASIPGYLLRLKFISADVWRQRREHYSRCQSEWRPSDREELEHVYLSTDNVNLNDLDSEAKFIKDLLNAGSQEIRCDTVEELRTQLVRAVARHNPEEEVGVSRSIWPLVLEAEAIGEFGRPGLVGLRVVDIPGNDDPGAIRAAFNFAETLSQVSRIWMCASRETARQNSLKESLQVLVLHGLIPKLQFIVTKIDTPISATVFQKLSNNIRDDLVRDIRDLSRRELSLHFGTINGLQLADAKHVPVFQTDSNKGLFVDELALTLQQMMTEFHQQRRMVEEGLARLEGQFLGLLAQYKGRLPTRLRRRQSRSSTSTAPSSPNSSFSSSSSSLSQPSTSHKSSVKRRRVGKGSKEEGDKNKDSDQEMKREVNSTGGVSILSSDGDDGDEDRIHGGKVAVDGGADGVNNNSNNNNGDNDGSEGSQQDYESSQGQGAGFSELRRSLLNTITTTLQTQVRDCQQAFKEAQERTIEAWATKLRGELQGIHYGTVQAIVRSRGTFKNATKSYTIAQWLEDVFLAECDAVRLWDNLFVAIGDLVQRVVSDLQEAIGSLPFDDDQAQDFRASQNTFGKSLIKRRLEPLRGKLTLLLHQALNAGLLPMFVESARDEGTGVLQRVRGAIEGSANKALFGAAQEAAMGAFNEITNVAQRGLAVHIGILVTRLNTANRAQAFNSPFVRRDV